MVIAGMVFGLEFQRQLALDGPSQLCAFSKHVHLQNVCFPVPTCSFVVRRAIQNRRGSNFFTCGAKPKTTVPFWCMLMCIKVL